MMQSNKLANKTNDPNPVDIHVGKRIRLRRALLGMSQQSLGEKLGVTFQQIQKYENGSNRVGASRLYSIAKALNVQVAFFYDEIKGKTKIKVAEEADSIEQQLGSRETLELVRAYYSIDDKSVRRKVLEMIKSITKASDKR